MSEEVLTKREPALGGKRGVELVRRERVKTGIKMLRGLVERDDYWESSNWLKASSQEVLTYVVRSLTQEDGVKIEDILVGLGQEYIEAEEFNETLGVRAGRVMELICNDRTNRVDAADALLGIRALKKGLGRGSQEANDGLIDLISYIANGVYEAGSLGASPELAKEMLDLVEEAFEGRWQGNDEYVGWIGFFLNSTRGDGMEGEIRARSEQIAVGRLGQLKSRLDELDELKEERNYLFYMNSVLALVGMDGYTERITGTEREIVSKAALEVLQSLGRLVKVWSWNSYYSWMACSVSEICEGINETSAFAEVREEAGKLASEVYVR